MIHELATVIDGKLSTIHVSRGVTLHKIMTRREFAYSAFTKINTLLSTITEQSLTTPYSVLKWAREFL
jgi:hypothetical protein